MDKTILFMPILSFVGFIVATAMNIVAYRNCGTEGSFKKFYTLCSMFVANFIYAILATFIMMNNGAYDLTVPCLVLGIATFVCSIVQGLICRNGIENGAMSDDKVMSRCILYCGFAEILSIAALVYFFLALN